jgi:hypothetical protein
MSTLPAWIAARSAAGAIEPALGPNPAYVQDLLEQLLLLGRREAIELQRVLAHIQERGQLHAIAFQP